MLSELEPKEKRPIGRAAWEADTTLKRALRWCLSNVHKMCQIWLLYLSCHSFIIHTVHSRCTSFLFPFTFRICGLFSCTGAFACVPEMQVKFLSHLLEPDLSSAFTNWSHLSQQCFEVYLHCGCQALSFPPLFLSHFFPYAFSSPSFSFYPFDSPYLFSVSLFVFLAFSSFFSSYSSIDSILSFFCLWAENWPKWMRSWRAVNTVIIWLLPAPLKA